jgi:uncharacterized cupin superfamily protein
MAKIFELGQVKFAMRGVPLPEFDWHTSERLGQLADSKRLIFDFRALDPGKFSFPYHFHRNAEELFFIVAGRCSLRTPEGIRPVKAGDLIYFESSPEGAHQLYNDSEEPCVYLDVRTFDGMDVTEYPDSDKVALLPGLEVFKMDSRVDYFEGETETKKIWDAVASATPPQVNAE